MRWRRNLQPVDEHDSRDLLRAQARISDLEELLLEAERKTREAYAKRDEAAARAKTLERQPRCRRCRRR